MPAESGAQPGPEMHRPSRRTMYLLAAPIALVIALSPVADALTTTWAATHPLALMALNSRNRILLLVTNQVDAFSYYTVGTIRLLLTDPLWFLVGILYGDTALQWASRRSRSVGRFLGWMDRNFNRAAWPFVLVAPNPIVSLLAGAARMNAALFLTLDVVGTIGRLWLIRVTGNVLSAPIDAVLRFFGRFRWPLLAFSVVLVAISVVRNSRKGTGELAEFRDLADEVIDDK